MADLWADRPMATAWYQRLRARPAFALAYAAPARDVFGYAPEPPC